MENALYISLSRQTALRRELAVVANNVANVNTASFKRELSIYETYPQKVKGGDTLAFVIDRGTATSYAPGPIQATDSAFDLAIAGPGFFAVDNGKGTHYTRNGSFRLDHENRLVRQPGPRYHHAVLIRQPHISGAIPAPLRRYKEAAVPKWKAASLTFELGSGVLRAYAQLGSVVALCAFHTFVALLGFDRKCCDRTGLESLQTDRLVGLLTIPIGADPDAL